MVRNWIVVHDIPRPHDAQLHGVHKVRLEDQAGAGRNEHHEAEGGYEEHWHTSARSRPGETR
eukprot:2596684-Prorocentrum_lima.AAC.1